MVPIINSRKSILNPSHLQKLVQQHWPIFACAGACIFILGYLFWPESIVRQPPGILAEKEPKQGKVKKKKKPWLHEDYHISPRATFKIKARVLSKKYYWSGREADLSPYDLALGWKQMSDQVVIDQLDISQRNRWYYFHYSNPPLAVRSIQKLSANMHIIPASDGVTDILDDVRVGNIIEMSGYLVYINAADGWHWQSSLTREDIGGGACEVVWVEEFAILD